MIKYLIPALLYVSPLASGALIVVDYSYASPLYQYVPGSAGRAAIDRAAAELNAVLVNHQLAAIPTQAVSGTASWNNGEFDLVSTISLSASYLVRNPVSVSDYARLATETFAANEIRIYVGSSPMPFSNYAIGSSAVVGITQFGAGYVPSWSAALSMAEANANALFGRGNQVIARAWNGSMPYGNIPGNFTVNFAPTAASVSFNAYEYWHADANTPVGEGEYDLYSVALQEMLRSLGVNPSEQLLRGQRAGLTTADLAALQANGWTVVPEPSFLMLSVLSLPLLARRKRP